MSKAYAEKYAKKKKEEEQNLLKSAVTKATTRGANTAKTYAPPNKVSNTTSNAIKSGVNRASNNNTTVRRNQIQKTANEVTKKTVNNTRRNQQVLQQQQKKRQVEARQNQRSGIKTYAQTMGQKESSTGDTIEGTLKQTYGGHMKNIGSYADNHSYGRYKDWVESQMASGKMKKEEGQKLLSNLEKSPAARNNEKWQKSGIRKSFTEIYRQGEKLNREGDEQVERAMEGASDLKKTGLQALGSGVGMATDLSAGPFSLLSMYSRSTGNARGRTKEQYNRSLYDSAIKSGMTEYQARDYVNRVGMTDREDELYANFIGLNEAGQELIFRGVGLPAKYAGAGKMGKLAERFAGKALKNSTFARSTALRTLRGVAEENAEEGIGFLAEGYLTNKLIDQNLADREARYSLQEQSKAFQDLVTDEASAQSAALMLGSDEFRNGQVNQFKSMGCSDREAKELAEISREYYTAKLSGDEDRAQELENIIAGRVVASNKFKISDLDASELWDTVKATTLLVGATGAPGAISTRAQGVQIKNTFGTEGLKGLAKSLQNTTDAKTYYKAKNIVDQLESGKEATPTQAWEMQQAFEEEQVNQYKKLQAKDDMTRRARAEEKLIPHWHMTVDKEGNPAFVLQEKAQETYDETKKFMTEYLKETSEETGIDEQTTENIADQIARFDLGAINDSDAFIVAYDNKVGREAFEAYTGVNLDQYVVRGKDGEIDIPATNEATYEAFYALAAENDIQAARVETENAIDVLNGQITDEMLPSMGSAGQSAWMDISKDIDSRDVGQTSLTMNAVRALYRMGRDTELTEEQALQAFGNVSRLVDKSVLTKAFQAGQADWVEEETIANHQAVSSGEAIAGTDTSSITTGKVTVSDEVRKTIKDSEYQAAVVLADTFGINIRYVDSLAPEDQNSVDDDTVRINQVNGSYNPDTRTITLNVNEAAEKNLSYVVMHEMTHHLKVYANEQYQKLEDFVFNEWMEQDAEGMQKRIDRIKKIYEAAGQKLSDDMAREEILADAMAEAMDDPDFARRVCEENPEVGKSVLNSIRYALRKLRRAYATRDYRNKNFSQALLSRLGILSEAEELWLNALQVAVKNRAQNTIDEIAEREIQASNPHTESRLSLTPVEPVQPSSDAWKSGATFSEVKTAHPTLFEQDTDQAEQSEENDKRHLTQVKNTVSTYNKIYDMLGEDFNGSILDASSGLGEGTRSGRENYGFDVDDIEPYPAEDYKPRYMDYSTLDKQYDVIISNAVLNVLTQDDRDAMVNHIGQLLKPGGRAFINVRGNDVLNAKNKIAIDESNMEYFIPKTTKSGYYQKGFTPKELKAYLEDALGEGFTVENSTKFGKSAAIVTKSGEANVRFSVSDDAQTIINQSMTMEECRQMIQRCFVLGNIREWSDGEYKNGDEWIRGAGVDEVAMIADNEFSIQQKYLNKVDALMSGDIVTEEILEAYVNGTLVGKEKPKAKRLDTAQQTGIVDNRFYAPQIISNAVEDYKTASQKITKNNREEVNAARAKVLLFAHNEGAEYELGLTRAELNKKLRSWGNYSASAREISQRINSNVAIENRWTGIENMSWLNKATVSNEELANLVKSIEGESSDYERAYIARTMLAIDTHIDWSDLSIVFKDMPDPNSRNTNGFYRDSERLIEVKHDHPNTVAHEMGHALDAMWGRDVGTAIGLGMYLTHYDESQINRIQNEEVKQFAKNFMLFIDSITDVSDLRSDYTQRTEEVFARFVDQFCRWTERIATGYSHTNTFDYNDKFTQAQYVEFAKLLQEKALLDGKGVFDKHVKYSIAEESRVMYTPSGVEVVQNPTDDEYRAMRKEILDESPWLRGTDTPLLRMTYDEEGNEYYWNAFDALHSQVEPYINKRYNTRTSQQWKWWESRFKDEYPENYDLSKYFLPQDRVENALKDKYEFYKSDEKNLKIASEALTDLQNSRMSLSKGNAQIRTLGKGITTEFINDGYVEFRGKKVRGPEDLAKLCQVLRDPRFETFRVVLTKGNKIVSMRSVSSRLPGMSMASKFPSFDDEIKDITNRMERAGADGFYLIHNHPSGDVTASTADLFTTERYINGLGGDKFKGHVILDHDKFGLIENIPVSTETRYGTYDLPKASEVKIRGQQTLDLIHQPEIDHPSLGAEIMNKDDIAALGSYTNTSDDVSVLLYMAASGEVRGIQEISNKTLLNNEEIAGYIKNQAVEFGSYTAALYTTDADVFDRSNAMIRSQHLIDAVYARKGLNVSAREQNNAQPQSGVEAFGMSVDDIVRRTYVFESAIGADRYSITPEMDSEGNELSQEQMEFFKDSEARDEEGRLLTLYHGTASAGFNTFNSNLIWLTTSRLDADSYAGNWEHKLYDPEEQDERELQTAGYHSLEDINPTYAYMHFDTEEDRQQFIEEHPDIDKAHDYWTLDDMLYHEEIDDYEFNRLTRADEEIRADYTRYEAKHSTSATWGDVFDNPDRFEKRDLARALLAYDREFVIDEEEEDTKETLLDAMRQIEEERIEDGEEWSLRDMRFKARIPSGSSAEVVHRANNRTYQVYANLVNPLEVDIDGRGIEGHYGYVDEMLNGDYDGLILRNCGVGRYHYNGDVVVAKTSSQVKLTTNENPTSNPDIRFSIPPEDDVLSAMAEETEDVDDMVATDPILEEGRKRIINSKEYFFNTANAKWNERWLTEGKVLKESSVRKNIRELVMATMQNSDTQYRYRKELVDSAMTDAKRAFRLMKENKHREASEVLWQSAMDMIENVEFIEDDGNFEMYKEIRQFLKGYPISIDERYYRDCDYPALRKRNFGKLLLKKTGTPVDVVYQELEEQWPGIFNSEEYTTPPDQLLHIEEVIQSNMDPYRKAYTSEEATALAWEIASDLYDIVYEGDEYVSIADSFKAKYDRLTQNMKTRHEEAMRKVQERSEKQLEKERGKTERQKERAESWKQKVADEKQKQREKEQKKRERREHLKSFGKIQKNYDWLVTRLLNPTKDKNIPEQFKISLAHMLQAFDLQTVRSKELEEKYGASNKTMQMRELRDRLKEVAKEDESGEFTYNGYLFAMMDAMCEKIDGKTIDALDIDDIKSIDKLLAAIVHNFNNYTKAWKAGKQIEIAAMGAGQINAMRERIDKYGKRKTYGGARGLADKLINEGEETPIYFFERLDPTGQGIGGMYKELRRGEDKHIRNIQFLRERFEAICGDYYKTTRKGIRKPGSELEKWRDNSQAQTFDLANGSITLTPAQMMSLYCLRKRPQACGHIIGNGIVASPVSFNQKMQQKLRENIKGKEEQVNSVMINADEVDTIIAALTPEQRKIAEALQSLLANEMADWGNETSMQLYGIKMFEDKDYFPIRSSREVLAKQADSFDVQEKIKNFGFTKPIVRGANNAIVIDDIFSVVANHCNQMSLYNSMAVPITDFMRVYNYKQENEDGSVTTVQAMIGEAFTRKANDYIMKFIADVNGNTKTRSDAVNDAMTKALANYKRASIGLNARVALQQPTAIFRSLMVLSPKYFLGVHPSKKATQELMDHCPIAQWKSWGHYDMDMGRDMEDIMMNSDWTVGDEISMGVYGTLDNMTWGMIWQAVKKEVADTHPDVEYESDEFFELCNERASEVFDKTQVVDSIFHRSDAMRSKNLITKMTTSFMAEPTLTFNVMRDSLVKANELWKDGNKTEALKTFNKMGVVLALNAGAVSAAAAIWDAVRGKGADDDDEKKFWELWYANFVENFKDNINLINNIYFIKDAYSLMDGWGTSNMALEGFETFFKGVSQAKKKLAGDSTKSWYEINMNLLGGIGYITGKPVKTFMRDAKALWDLFGIDLQIFAADGSEDLDKTPIAFIKDGSKLDNLLNQWSINLTPREAKNKKAGDKEAVKDVQTGLSSREYNEILEQVKEEGLSGKDFDRRVSELIAEKSGNVDVSYRDESSSGSSESKTGAVPNQKEAAMANLKALEEKALLKTEGKTGKEKADILWDVIGDNYTYYVSTTNWEYINDMRSFLEANGGDVDAFDQKVLDAARVAYKKTLVDINLVPVARQQALYDYMTEHGMTEEQISSEILYKSDTARDLKAAFRMGNEEYIQAEASVLVQAGLTYEDFEKLYKYRNSGRNTYKGKYSDPKFSQSTGKYSWPISGEITSGYGYRGSIAGTNPFHAAIDIGGNIGDPIAAADGGTVIAVTSGYNGGYGNQVIIRHDDGTETWYSHMSGFNVNVGDVVGKGDQIGQVGSTGASTGPHLDFRVKVNGEFVNPLEYLQSA